MLSMKVQIAALLMSIPGANTQVVPVVNFTAADTGTMGGDGMDGMMAMPVVAGSRHFSKTQLARGTENVTTDEVAIDSTAILFVPIIAIILCSLAYFLIMTEQGREVAASCGCLPRDNNLKWSKMPVSSSQDADQGKWVRMAQDQPLVQQAMSALGMRSPSQPEGTEMNSFGGGEQEDWKPSTADACRKSAKQKLEKAKFASGEKPKAATAEDDFDPNVPAEAKEDTKADTKTEAGKTDLMGGSPEEDATASKEEPTATKDGVKTKEDSVDLLGKGEDDAPKEPCFDPIQIETSSTEAAPAVEEEEDTTAAFMASRGGAAAMSPEDFLKSLSTPMVEPAPVEKKSAAFRMDEDELLSEVFNAPAPACLEQPKKTVEAAPEAAPAPAFEKITTVFNFDDDDF